MKSDPEDFRRALLDHFDRRRRSLPWRRERTPYRVMVSEFMLQQTRAETVIPYYDRWLRRFPGWDALAGATADDVLLAWKGLGYYRRARSLHRTAMIVRERYGGRLPGDPAELRTLPGVGEYTAGAVASIAFGVPVPAVDGNVKRVLSRLLDVGDPTAAQLRDEATRLLDPERPGDFNEAIMELGATVCTPRSPRCHRCPVRPHCLADKAGTVGSRPLKRRRPPLPRVDYVTAVVVRGGAPVTLLTRRPATGLLAGMWEFPTAEIHRHPAGATTSTGAPASTRSPASTRTRLTAAALELLATLGLSGDPVAHPAPVKHTFSHFHATYHPVIVRCEDDADNASAMRGGTSAMPGDTSAVWIDPARLDGVALPVAQQKIGVRLVRRLARGSLRGSPRGIPRLASG